MASYVYTKSPVALDKLIDEIEASTITISLDKATTNVLGDQLTIGFKTEISNDEKTVLDGIVSNHDGIPIIDDTPTSVEVTNEPRIEYTTRYSLMADCASGTCDPGATADIDYKVINQSGESYVEKFLYGGEAFGKNIEYGDKAEFSIVDKDGWLVSTGQMDQQTFDAIKPVTIKKYVVSRFIRPDGYTNIRAEAPGRIPVGLYLRMRYEAVNSGTTRTLFINYDLNNKD